MRKILQTGMIGVVQKFMLGDDEYTIEEVERSPHFIAFRVRKNSELWTYVNIGVFESVLALWRHGGSPVKAADFLREVARYVIQLATQNSEIKSDIEQLRKGKPIRRYIFLPADMSASAIGERTSYHEAGVTPESTVRRIKWLVEVNIYRLAHRPTFSL